MNKITTIQKVIIGIAIFLFGFLILTNVEAVPAVIVMIGYVSFLLLPFVIADKMAKNRDITRLGIFIVTIFLSWIVPVVLLFVKIK